MPDKKAFINPNDRDPRLFATVQGEETVVVLILHGIPWGQTDLEERGAP